MKVKIKLQDEEEVIYQDVDNIEKSKYEITIYGEDDNILAIINKGDLKNLITYPDNESK